MTDEDIKSVKKYYELPNGEFGIVEIDLKDKVVIDSMVKVLKLLGIHKKFNRDKLLYVWKDLNKGVVRKFGRWRGPIL